LKKNPFLKVLNDCSDDYEQPPCNYRDSRAAEGPQAKGQVYLLLSFSSHSFIKKDENTKIVFRGVNYV